MDTCCLHSYLVWHACLKLSCNTLSCLIIHPNARWWKKEHIAIKATAIKCSCVHQTSINTGFWCWVYDEWLWCFRACGQVCGICVCGCRHRVTLVNIKAALYLAELTNLSHPLPRAAFETHTGGLHFSSLNTILRNPSSSSCRIIIQLHVHSLLLSPHLKSFLNFIFTAMCWRPVEQLGTFSTPTGTIYCWAVTW